MASDSANDETHDVLPSLDEVADALYGLAPQDFTAARNDYEKAARRAGDRDLAGRIRALAKPSVAAWLANQLARKHREELAPLLELGAGLREATRALAGEQLRELSRRQHQVVYALAKRAREQARASGHSVSEVAVRGVEDTLRAALADEDAAAQLLAGRLSAALEPAGFGALGAGHSDTGRRRTSEPRTSVSTVGERLHQAERDVADAQRALTEAERTRDAAQTHTANAHDAAKHARDQAERLRGELDRALAAAEEAERRHRDGEAELRLADGVVAEAQQRQQEAEQRRDRLSHDG